MALTDAVSFVNPWYVIIGLVSWITVTIWTRHLVADYKIRRLGATRAPVLLMNPISGMTPSRFLISSMPTYYLKSNWTLLWPLQSSV